MIERSRVRVPSEAVGDFRSFFFFSSPESTFFTDFYFSIRSTPCYLLQSHGGEERKKNDPGRSAKSVGDEVMQVNRKL